MAQKMKRDRSNGGRPRPTGGRVRVQVAEREWLPLSAPTYPLAEERLQLAVRALAVGAGEIKERLTAAFIHMSPLREGDVPEELRSDLLWVRGKLLKNPPKLLRGIDGGRVRRFSRGRLGATVPHMRIASAVQVAERICYMESRLTHLCSAAEGGNK